VIYISEAHAKDEWPISHTHQTCQHKNITERINEAKKINVIYPYLPKIYCDFFGEDSFERNFSAWPERVFILKDNILEFISAQNVDGLPDWYDHVEEYCKKL
jgi:hypothetical protein